MKAFVALFATTASAITIQASAPATYQGIEFEPLGDSQREAVLSQYNAGNGQDFFKNLPNNLAQCGSA